MKAFAVFVSVVVLVHIASAREAIIGGAFEGSIYDNAENFAELKDHKWGDQVRMFNSTVRWSIQQKQTIYVSRGTGKIYKIIVRPFKSVYTLVSYAAHLIDGVVSMPETGMAMGFKLRCEAANGKPVSVIMQPSLIVTEEEFDLVVESLADGVR